MSLSDLESELLPKAKNKLEIPPDKQKKKNISIENYLNGIECTSRNDEISFIASTLGNKNKGISSTYALSVSSPTTGKSAKNNINYVDYFSLDDTYFDSNNNTTINNLINDSNNTSPKINQKGPSKSISDNFLKQFTPPTISGAMYRWKRPKIISNYVLGSLMGDGTYSSVRDAIDLSKRIPERVAIKILRRNNINIRSEKVRKAQNEMIENEKEMLQRFHHPKINRAIDIFSKYEKEYIVLPIAVCSLQEFIKVRIDYVNTKESNDRRGSNESSLKRSPSSVGIKGDVGNGSMSNDSFFKFSSITPPQMLQDVIIQVLQGLEYMHLQSCYHNDVKPSNILLFGDGNVKLSDFGCTGPTFITGRHGTPAFVSPQVVAHLTGQEVPGVIEGTEEINAAKNDVWALGVVMYVLITGHLPFGESAANDPDANITQFTLYNEILTSEADFNVIPEDSIAVDEDDKEGRKKTEVGKKNLSWWSRVSPNKQVQQKIVGFGRDTGSARNLVMRMLDKSQSKRISVTEALSHPWLAESLERSPGVTPGNYIYPLPNQSNNVGQSSKNLRRVFNVREISKMVVLDVQRSMHLAAEIAHILRIKLPKELYLYPCDPLPEKLIEPVVAIAIPSPKNCLYRCVDSRLFMTESEMYYYSKRGNPEKDIISLRKKKEWHQHIALYADNLIRVCEDNTFFPMDRCFDRTTKNKKGKKYMKFKIPDFCFKCILQ